MYWRVFLSAQRLLTSLPPSIHFYQKLPVPIPASLNVAEVVPGRVSCHVEEAVRREGKGWNCGGRTCERWTPGTLLGRLCQHDLPEPVRYPTIYPVSPCSCFRTLSLKRSDTPTFPQRQAPRDSTPSLKQYESNETIPQSTLCYSSHFCPPAKTLLHFLSYTHRAWHLGGFRCFE